MKIKNKELKEQVANSLTDEKRIFKVSCDYYIQVDDTDDAKDMAEDFVNNEMIDGNFVESHIMIEETSGIKDDDIYNHPKWDK